MNILSDSAWHTTDEILKECEKAEINLNGKRDPIYNIMHSFKKNSKIETSGTGKYRLKPNQNTSCEESIQTKHDPFYNFDNKIIDFQNIKMLLTKYENFDWINCNDIELQNARKEVNCLLKLSEEIQNKFKKKHQNK